MALLTQMSYQVPKKSPRADLFGENLLTQLLSINVQPADLFQSCLR